MSWKNQLRSDSLQWLLESENPGVRFLALRDLLDLSPEDKKLKAARKLAHKEEPIAHILFALGFGKDPRLANTLELIRSKQDEQGRWLLEYNYDGKTWMRFGKMKEPNEWVTLRALRVLKAAEYALPAKT